MTQKNITMQTIADQLGISKVSVSKALNNQPGVSEDLKRRVIETAYKVGYIKSRNVRNQLKIKKLGFLVPKHYFLESENFYRVIYYYLSKECASKNINLVLYIINADNEKNLTLPFSLTQDELDGLFIAGEVSNGYIHLLRNLDMPLIAIDFYKPGISFDCIVTDNFYASFLATMYLVDCGHKNIGFVGNPNSTSSIMDRYYGYLKALRQSNLKFCEDWLIVNNDQSGTYFYNYSLPSPMPTAFVCHCDMAAHHLMIKLQNQDISIPNDVSIISFDNTDLSSRCIPQLTTVDINKKEIAERAFHQMNWRINNLKSEPQRIIISTHLIERESVRKLI